MTVTRLQCFANKPKVDVAINEPQQMIFGNVIFRAQVVKKRLRTSLLAHHHKQRTSREVGRERHQELDRMTSAKALNDSKHRNRITPLHEVAMRKLCIAFSIFMLGAPFVLLALTYPALPSQLVVLRGPFGLMMAQKSFFSVFRVPMMNFIAAMIAWVMLSRAQDFGDGERRVAFSAAFATLLFAIALKSDFEALEISAPAFSFGASGRALLASGTMASIVCGLVIAFVRGRRARIPWPELRLSTRTKAALVSLFAAYLVLAMGSVIVAHRAYAGHKSE